MITPEEEKYLQTIPENVTVTVRPYNPNVLVVAQSLIDRIKKADPTSEVQFMGASALKIAGQNDIDLYILSPTTEFDHHLPALTEEFGEPTATSPQSIKWAFMQDDFDVALYLTDPDTPSMQRQIEVFEKLCDNPNLLHEYEQLKLSAGTSLREYQRQKYEFYNRILSS